MAAEIKWQKENKIAFNVSDKKEGKRHKKVTKTFNKSEYSVYIFPNLLKHKTLTCFYNWC